jgi:hypothetical protein
MAVRFAGFFSLIVFAFAGQALASEEDFVFGTDMPLVEGKAVRTVTREDKPSGLTFRQTIYRQDRGTSVVSTFVVEAGCADAGMAPAPYIIAIKVQPKSPQSMSVAGLHDVYRDVFVRDRDQRIRIYQNLGGREMAELTETFRPDCLGI